MTPGSIWGLVARSAGIQVIVSALSGVLGIVSSRLIITHFGLEAYAQYGLLASLPALIPFADLGIAAVIMNNIAASDDPRTDPMVRRTITSAWRILIGSGATIASLSVIIYLLGLWPVLLGSGLLPGGDVSATLCLVIFGLALPLGIGSRVLVALGRNPLQTALGGLTAPFVLVGILVCLQFGASNFVAVSTYVASAIVYLTLLLVAAHLIRPQMGAALRDVPGLRRAPGIPVLHLAAPMLVQMISLPIAMQSSRVLLSHNGTATELAQYNLASQLFNLVLQSIATGGVALWPYFAKARSDGHVKSPFKASLSFIVCGFLVSAALAAMLPVITRVVSDGQLQIPWALALAFVAFTAAQAAKYPLGMYMTDVQGLRFQVVPVIAMVPLNIGLTVALIPLLGAAGPVVAVTLSVILCQVVPNALWVRRRLTVAA